MKVKVIKGENGVNTLLTNLSDKERETMDGRNLDSLEEYFDNESEKIFKICPSLKEIVFSTDKVDDDSTYNNIHGEDCRDYNYAFGW